MNGGFNLKFVQGLYVSTVMIIAVYLINETIFNGEYAGIAMWISMGIFIVATAFYLNAKIHISNK